MKNDNTDYGSKKPLEDISPRLFCTALCMMAAVASLIWLVGWVVL